MSNQHHGSSDYTLLDFAAEFSGDRGEEHREAIKEAEDSADDPHE